MIEPTIIEGYELPSKGLIYGDKGVQAHVELRSMTTSDEMKRSAPSNTPYKVLAEIIESCMLTKPKVSVYDMCLGDYEYLLHKLRVISHGADYDMSVVCPHCGQIVEVTMNLDDLVCNEYDQSEIDALLNVTLPKSGRNIELKYQTPRILDEIKLKTETFMKKSKGAGIDPTIMITLQTLISTVDGEKLSYLQLEDFIKNLKVADSLFLMDRIDKLNKKVGLDTSIDLTCSKCGGDILTFFRWGPEFFRPSID